MADSQSTESGFENYIEPLSKVLSADNADYSQTGEAGILLRKLLGSSVDFQTENGAQPHRIPGQPVQTLPKPGQASDIPGYYLNMDHTNIPLGTDELNRKRQNFQKTSLAPGFAEQIQQAENSGPGAVSPAGATGTMQVMPATAANPGFGIAPANPSDPADINRVGVQYANALLQKYGGNEELTAAAYNAGPGRVDQWLGQFGDPRNGLVSPQAWQQSIPFKETKNYVGRFVGQSNSLMPAPLAPVQNAPEDKDTNSLQTNNSNQSASPQIALKLMQLLLPSTHTFQPVDYDPWALQPTSKSV